jgi:predicted nucleic acid-binding protein
VKRITLYLDTSILSFYHAQDCPDEMQITRQLLSEIKGERFEAFISTAVLEEIARAPEQMKKELLGLIRDYKFTLLEITEEIDILAKEYIKNNIIPERFELDAVHIACAVVNNIDVIVSWNFEHIVRLRTRLAVNAISKVQGYKEIEICSPREVIEYEV